MAAVTEFADRIVQLRREGYHIHDISLLLGIPEDVVADRLLDPHLDDPEATGPQGPQGVPGAAGPQGTQGDRGPQGLGPQGNPGVQGAPGANGAAGAAGPQGPVGVGVQGPAGPQGAVGGYGSQGSQGDKGAQGDTGAAGPQGPIGVTGPQGANGAQGVAGAAGAQGAAGAAGAAGAQGAQGAAGSYATYKKVQLLSGPQGYWPMDDIAALAVTDLENGVVLTAPNGSGHADDAAAGLPVGGRAVNFDGANYGFAVATPVLTSNIDWAIGGWVFVPAGGMKGEIAKVGTGANGMSVGIGSGGSFEAVGTRVYGLLEANRWIDSGMDVVANAWNFVIFQHRNVPSSALEVLLNNKSRFYQPIDAGHTIGIVPTGRTSIGGDSAMAVAGRKPTAGVKLAHITMLPRAMDPHEFQVLRRWRP